MTPATLNRHGLERPTVRDLRTSLTRLVPDDLDGFVSRACVRAGVSATTDLPVEDLRRLCEAIIADGGLPAVGARGIAVRCSSYVLLSK